MNRQLQDFQKQAQRGQELSREELYPGEITFGNRPSTPCSVRAGLSHRAYEEGFEYSEPNTFLLLKSDLPAGVSIQAKLTRFHYLGREMRVVTVLSQPAEAQVRFVGDLPSSKSRG